MHDDQLRDACARTVVAAAMQAATSVHPALTTLVPAIACSAASKGSSSVDLSGRVIDLAA